MHQKYLFQTNRLGFRVWQPSDLQPFGEINADPETMRFFKNPYSLEETQAMMDRMARMFEEKGYCYFAVDLLENQELIGAIGLGWKTFEADFTPCVDIGWRISKNYWNKGLTTEGAKACLEFAKRLGIPEVFSYATSANLPSIQIMKKIGMHFSYEFELSELREFPHLKQCTLYHIDLLNHV